MRVRVLLLALVLACAEPPEAPPASGRACETHADCRRIADAGEPGCGFLPLCIAGRCTLTADAPDLDRCEAEPIGDASVDRDE